MRLLDYIVTSLIKTRLIKKRLKYCRLPPSFFGRNLSLWSWKFSCSLLRSSLMDRPVTLAWLSCYEVKYSVLRTKTGSWSGKLSQFQKSHVMSQLIFPAIFLNHTKMLMCIPRINKCWETTGMRETDVSEPWLSLACCPFPGDCKCRAVVMMMMSAGDNSWLVYQSSLAVPPAETSESSRRNEGRNENFAYSASLIRQRIFYMPYNLTTWELRFYFPSDGRCAVDFYRR
jgi:hypothetical protein